MHDILDRIADVLLEVESTLRNIGKWEKKQPTAEALTNSVPFCMDTLKFEQWLQWVFLPQMKVTLEEIKPLPAKSDIFTYAKECLHRDGPSTDNLLVLIKRFDDLITIQSGVKRH